MGGEIQDEEPCANALSEVLNEIDEGTYMRPSSLSFQKFAKAWLLGRRQIRGSTEAGYNSPVDKELVSRLGSLKARASWFEDVDAAVSGMIEDELASKTIDNAIMLLRNMLAGRKGPSAFRRGVSFCGFYVGRRVAAT